MSQCSHRLYCCYCNNSTVHSQQVCKGVNVFVSNKTVDTEFWISYNFPCVRRCFSFGGFFFFFNHLKMWEAFLTHRLYKNTSPKNRWLLDLACRHSLFTLALEYISEGDCSGLGCVYCVYSQLYQKCKIYFLK